MYRKNYSFILFCTILVLSLVLGACGGIEPEPREVSDKTVEQFATDESDDTEAQQAISPLAPPESPLAEPAHSVEMPPLEAVYDDETGGVTGQLIFIDENGENPVPDIMLALGTMLKDDKGQSIVVSYKAATAPRTVTDEHGRFVFNEIAPETYALILDAAIASSMLAYPDREVSIVFDVVPDGLIELGALRYEELPAPGYTK